MQLALNEDQQLILDAFTRFFEEHSSIARVRQAEASGFDEALWRALGELGFFAMRTPGELEYSLFDTALVVEAAGQRLASGPLIEGLLGARLLGLLAPHDELALKAASAEAVVVIAPKAADDAEQIVTGGAVADAVLFLDGDEVRLLRQDGRRSPPPNHANQPLSLIRFSGPDAAPSVSLAAGTQARAAFLQVVEEWKLLTAAMLNGIARQAIRLAADYAQERTQFNRPIGSFQGVAHPLADCIADLEGARLLLWSAFSKVSKRAPDAAAEISMSYWWSCETSARAVRRAMHTFGGYGLTNEYDIQLYRRRAKGIALANGDPADELLLAGTRAYLGAPCELPDIGPVSIDFDLGVEAETFAAETRVFFDSYLTPEWVAKSHYSYDGHDWDLNQAMGERGLLFPTWKEKWGGRGADAYVAAAGMRAWDDYGVTTHAQAVSNMVGLVIERFGTEQLKQAYLPQLAAGKIISCLGYTEPHSGSDAFAAKTRAVRDGDDWVINGQKMFTSGANLASHVLLLTRTDPDAPKHLGMTLFIVPLDDPGVEIHPIHTYQEERTNATFYSDVRVADWRRLGEINGGSEIFGWALSLEQGGGAFCGPHRRAVEAAIEWARTEKRDGDFAIRSPRILERIVKADTHARVSELLYFRSLWLSVGGARDRAAGPMSKLFSSEYYLRDATDLFDLTAPASLLRGKGGVHEIELSARHGEATTIYAGTSEVHRSQVAEKALGLPRSR